MATVEDLKAALAGQAEDIATISGQAATLADTLSLVLVRIQELKDQVAAGGVVSQADLDSLTASAQDADAAGDVVKEALNAVQLKAEAGIE